MSVQQAPTKTRKRSHALVRGVWLALVILTMGTFFASLPVYIAQQQTPCAGTACGYGALLTPEQAGMLKGIGLSIGDFTAYTVALTLTTMVVCLVVSTVIIWRRSDDRMALLVALMLVTLGPINSMNSLSASLSPWQLPAACLYFIALVLLFLVFSLFPTGQFVPRWTRWTLVVSLAVQVLSTFFPNAPFTQHTNALAIGYLVLLGEAAILAVVQLYRYRRVSNPLQRQQTKWVVFGLAVPITVIVVGYGLMVFPAFGDPSSPSGLLYQLAVAAISTCLPLFIPLSLGFAMLRYRLWDIDVLINRALVYGGLSGALALLYTGLVFALQFLLRGLIHQDSTIAIVASTLVIAALFQPLRHGLQKVIDRRFYRRKYDAARTLAAFSATLRNEVDLDQLRGQLVAVVQETMQPAHVSLWLRPPEPSSKRKTWLLARIDEEERVEP